LFALYDALQKQNRRFELHWYGDVPPKAWPELAKRPGMVVHGLQSRADVRKAMMRMDVLVNIGNVTTWQLPSKAAEYYASGKPVLHVAQTANDAFERFFKGASRLYVLHYRMDRVEGDLPELFITESNVDATFLETASVWQWYQNG
jgi:hypothetical protein